MRSGAVPHLTDSSLIPIGSPGPQAPAHAIGARLRHIGAIAGIGNALERYDIAV